QRSEVARHGQAHPGDAGFGGRVGDLADLAFEGGDQGGVVVTAGLFFLGLVLAHQVCRQPADVEGGDQVEIDGLAERLEIVRTGFRYGALPDPATRRGHRDVQATQL